MSFDGDVVVDVDAIDLAVVVVAAAAAAAAEIWMPLERATSSDRL